MKEIFQVDLTSRNCLKLSDLAMASMTLENSSLWNPTLVFNVVRRIFKYNYPWIISSLPMNVDSLKIDTSRGEITINRNTLQNTYEEMEDTETWTWEMVESFHTTEINNNTQVED